MLTKELLLLPHTCSHVFCGNLVCAWKTTNLIQSKKFDYQYTFYGDQLCVSAAPRNDSRTGPHMVEDGTTCGEDRAS